MRCGAECELEHPTPNTCMLRFLARGVAAKVRQGGRLMMLMAMMRAATITCDDTVLAEKELRLDCQGLSSSIGHARTPRQHWTALP